MAGIDRGLAADRGIDLRQERRRYLHVVEAAANHRGCETGKVADHATAKRNHEIAALDASLDQRLAHALEYREALGPFTRRHDHGRGGADAGERRLRSRQTVARNRLVADDRNPRARTQRRDPLPERIEHAATDHDIVAARTERDIDDDGLARPQWRGHDAQSPPAAAAAVTACAMRRCLANAPIISSTIFSCTTSRDWPVRSACAYVGWRKSISSRNFASGSSVLSSGRSLRRLIRRISTSKSAFSQTEMPLALMTPRVSAFMNAPPPVATTCAPPSSRRAITRASPERNSGSPRVAKISSIDMPAAISISASASTNGMSSRCARRRPIDDLPAPIMPTSTIARPLRAATIAASRAAGAADGCDTRSDMCKTPAIPATVSQT